MLLRRSSMLHDKNESRLKQNTIELLWREQSSPTDGQYGLCRVSPPQDSVVSKVAEHVW